MYKIQKYSFDRAKELNVIIKPSIVKNKKIDVYSSFNIFIVSIGDIRYKDYPTLLELEKKGILPPGTAKERQRIYNLRHSKTRNIKFSRSWYADKILW